MVFVLDKKKKPLMPCTEKRARKLLQSGRAVVHRLMPFVIRLKDRTAEESNFQPLRLKFDPGSKTTGFSVLREESAEKSAAIIMGEIHHKQGIKDRLDSRRALRRGRRNRKTRYRKPRFDNRRREEGWLPPSLEAGVEETVRAAEKLMKWLPITSISTEHAKFDTQLMQNPEISGIEYQQGELYGYEIREYLLEKYGRKCAYCAAENVPLQIEHVVPRNPKHGPKGTNRVSNLTISCERCNKDKGNKQPEEWLEELQRSKRKIDRVRAEKLLKVLANLKKPLKDAAMMNATRWALYERLKRTGLPVECGTGARTKKQRIEHGFPKTHYFDACCVGASTPKTIEIKTKYIEIWTAVGRGNRKMCNTDKYGFPISHRQRKKRYFGFQTGDMVKAEVPSGKYKGTWRGRVAVRASGYFDIKDSKGNRICQGISYRYVRLLQYADGWQYEKEKAAY